MNISRKANLTLLIAGFIAGIPLQRGFGQTYSYWPGPNSNNGLITGSSYGDVGIGPSAPIRRLHLSRSGYPEMLIEDTSFTGMGRIWGVSVSGGNLSFRYGASAYNSTAVPMAYMTAAGNLGIGTFPAARLDVYGDQLNDYVGTVNIAGNYVDDQQNRPGQLTITTRTDATKRLSIGVHQTSDYANIEYVHDDHNWGPLILQGSGGSVMVGTFNKNQTLYTLTVNGTVGAKEVIVTNGISADYVFKPGYRLRPLSEVSDFINKNGHLPEIPSEKEVKQNGVGLSDMQARLLAKVEELTLHLIAQEKQIQELRSRMGKAGDSNANGR